MRRNALAVEYGGEGNGTKKSNYHTIFSLLWFSSQNNLKREEKRKTSAIDCREYRALLNHRTQLPVGMLFKLPHNTACKDAKI